VASSLSRCCGPTNCEVLYCGSTSPWYCLHSWPAPLLAPLPKAVPSLQQSQTEICSEASVTSTALFSRLVLVIPDFILVHIRWMLESSCKRAHCLHYLPYSMPWPWGKWIKNSTGEYIREKTQNRDVPCKVSIQRGKQISLSQLTVKVTFPLVGIICRHGFHLLINSQKITVMDLQQSDSMLVFLERSSSFR